MSEQVVLVMIEHGVAVVTMNRPHRRNALNAELITGLRETMAEVDADESVDAIVLTGTDPAFCAGLDLNDLGAGRTLVQGATGRGGEPGRPWARTAKPVIGAVNGPAVTGGFEIALQCDFLVASDRASFADTHTRVGILPGWGMSVLLPQAVGVRKAKEMSLTGNFVRAEEARAFGLVNHVVPHEQLLPKAVKLARDISDNDGAAVRTLLASYEEIAATTVGEGLRVEARVAADWNANPAASKDVERRREGIVKRGRAQV